ncbi:MAG TPA: glucan 1,4-alpha-glucosidase [Thioalkalivibrio sp.]|nr:glucan 1,4-alpha-glucosidase [Thioalkalivibrio sp.]
MSEAAFGRPGLPATWSSARKQAVGTALSTRSRVWFTVGNGVLTEVYWPTVDCPNQRDLQLLITDGGELFHEERRDLEHRVEWLEDGVPAIRVTSDDPAGRYRLVKTLCTDPEADCIMMRVRFEPRVAAAEQYRLYVLWAPQLGNQGGNNEGYCHHAFTDADWLLARQGGVYAALTASVPFARMSAGYVGHSDGWQDLEQHRQMTWSFDAAGPGHIALTAEILPGPSREFTLCLGFGRSEGAAFQAASDCMHGRGFDAVLKEYMDGWRAYQAGLLDLSRQSTDGGRLYRRSVAILRTHMDKQQPGAGVASLSIPWGEATSADEPTGGYHLVWPRDLYQQAMGLLAAGDRETPVQILDYLSSRQQNDGYWLQNFWVDGRPYWKGLQLDEVGYPVLLAERLRREGLLEYDPYPLVRRAADFLIGHGPLTPQDRWEENRGYSPHTLAVIIAALYAAAAVSESAGKAPQATTYRRVAQGWEQRIEDWTFTDCGRLLPDHPEHYERIAQIPPAETGEHLPECRVFLPIRNLPPEAMVNPSQCCVVDGGFLELVRLGLRAPDDPHVLKTLPVWDALCRRDTPCGPAWFRYNGDGYGEHEDGAPFDGTGRGRLWPLLTGERGHYELAAGRDPLPFIRALECFANDGGMLPEQVWEAEPIPARGLTPGRGTGSATPLAWAHAEYIRLLRSRKDRKVFDRPDRDADEDEV